MVHFVGAGSGAVDLITVRGQKLVQEADVVIYAGSLVNPDILKECKESCAIYNSAEMTLEEVVAAAQELIDHAKMCFLPENLQFLHAGGRVSNAAYLGSRILGIHPVIEILDGKLTATKKYRGKMKKVAVQLINEYAKEYNLKKKCLWLVYTIGLDEEIRKCVEEAAYACGFETLQWIQANGVITTHGGPSAFGLAGFAE